LTVDTKLNDKNRYSIVPLKARLLLELQRTKAKLAKKNIRRIETFSEVQASFAKTLAFFCQIDGEKHASIELKHSCIKCARDICDDCYIKMNEVGVKNCPYCGGKLQIAFYNGITMNLR
jgi:hypothetical protein